MDDAHKSRWLHLINTASLAQLQQQIFAQERDTSIGRDSIAPQLFIYELPADPDNDLISTIVLLSGPSFNERRHEILYAVGRQCQAQGMTPGITFLLAEAWMRRFAPGEEHKPETRQIADYADKVETLVLFGMNLLGDTALTAAVLHRSRTGRIQRYDTPYTCPPGGEPGSESPLLKQFWRGFRDATATRAQDAKRN